jgi:phosphoribosylaminoimidazole-succinocarboxamide synthase
LPAADSPPGRAQPSFDKQFVRDYCETLGWDKTAPGPELPSEIVEGTRARYVEAFERLTSIPFDAYLADTEVVLR